MRFEELALEKYGMFDSLTLPLTDCPGLVVIYGPNEAGKSTWLAAIADFLFGIPHNSPHGQIFGYGQMRLTAKLRTANGESQTFRRRKGVKSLSDETNKAIDERALSVHLGGTTRDRFMALFGLDHTSLRLGGERLLEADGDIGRLIVEAGGGLRGLVTALDKLKMDVEKLYSARRSSDRAFYNAFDAFDTANKEVKAGFLSRQAFDEARNAQETTSAGLAEARASTGSLTEQASSLRRLARVIPLLIELGIIEKECLAYADLSALRNDFAAAVRDAFDGLQAATVALRDSEDTRSALEDQVNGLIVPTDFVAAEAAIRDIIEKATHVGKARTDRPNRQRELADAETKLAALGRSIGCSDAADLNRQMPSQAAIDLVQALIPRGSELPPTIESAETQVKEESILVAQLEARRTQHQERGEDKPFGVSINEFAQLPVLTRSLELKRKQTREAEAACAARLNSLGFASLKELRSLDCPDSAIISDEIQRCAAFDADNTRLVQLSEQWTLRRDTAIAEIQRLTFGDDLPSSAAIGGARSARRQIWTTIREVFLDSSDDAWLRTDASQRLQATADMEQKVDDADSLADRRVAETQRLAALDLAERDRTEAVANLAAAIDAQEQSRLRLDRAKREWTDSWPLAVQRESDLGRLKALSTERAAILERAEMAASMLVEAELLATETDPKTEMLQSAEERLGISQQRNESLAARVRSVVQLITAHDDAYADYRRDVAAVSDSSIRLATRRENLSNLTSAFAAWRAEWTLALAAVGLEKEVSPARGNEVVTQWAAAGGVLDGRDVTSRRLRRMDDDERDLDEAVAKIVGVLDFSLPADSVAAAKMLEQRWAAANEIAIRRKSLEPQLVQQTKDCDRKRTTLNDAEVALTVLCAEAGCQKQQLRTIAARCDERADLARRRQQLIGTIGTAADGYALDALREQRCERDLDVIAAELARVEEELQRVDRSREAAAVAAESAKQDVDRFMTSEGINQAVAGRESATTAMQHVVERYVELSLAGEFLSAAINQIRGEQQDPLVIRAGELFALSSNGAFLAVDSDIDEKGRPIVVGKRSTGESVRVGEMSDGTRDQLFLAFRLASLEHYCASSEPLPLICDDLLVHFDDDRSSATLDLLAEIGKTTQVLLFTHHRKVVEGAAILVERGTASVFDLSAAPPTLP